MSEQTRLGLQERQGASPALPPSAEPLNAMRSPAPLSPDRNSEERSRDDDSRPNVGVRSRHSVFVLSRDGRPLTPTTPTRARKLLRVEAAVPAWSRFNTFGIRLVDESRCEVPFTALGVDLGTKFEGYSVVAGSENVLNVKLDLPDKAHIVRKMRDRQVMRHARRHRNCRRRPVRFDNRRGSRRRDRLAPSQAVIVGSRLKVMRELIHMYHVDTVGLEDVKFNHAKYRWGANFSTVEIGKARVRQFFSDRDVRVIEYWGYETKALREKYVYRKTKDKAADKFTAHCSDSLALAVDVSVGERVEPGIFLVVDDTYRCKRRHLHYAQPSKGGVRKKYSCGTVFGLRKGVQVGSVRCGHGTLQGKSRKCYRFCDASGARHEVSSITWCCGHFAMRVPAVGANRTESK